MNPKVSIAMVTYNQESYISQAIESVLAQQVDFAYEIVIGEDCSVDGTREKCRSFQEKYPDRVRLLERETNMGMTRNFLSTIGECRGEYLAILEGDDFWIDPFKLQKQVDLLDADRKCALAFTRTEAFFEDGRPGYEIPPPHILSYDLENLLYVNFIATCSVMYRRELVIDFPAWLPRLEMLDWPLHVLYAQHGKIGFINVMTAKYRIHPKSHYSSRKTIQNLKSALMFYRIINTHLGFKYSKSIKQYQANLCKEIHWLSADEGNWVDRIRYKLFSLWYQVLAKLR